MTIRWAASRSPRVALRQAAPADEKPATANSTAPASDVKSAAKQAAPGDQKTVRIIDGSSGTHRDVVIGSDAGDKAEADAPPAMMAGIDPRLLEKSRYGMIPVVSDGLKPFTVYAAEADRARAAKMPVVSIVVGGLGVGAAKTTDAIMKLPAAVTLALRPTARIPPNSPNAPACSATRFCCRFRWSRSIIPTMTPARRPCSRP